MTEFDALPDPLAVALDIARHLERLGVEYLVAGSLASSLHGEPRATLDVDLVASLLPSHASSLARDLASDYYIDEETARRAIAEGRSFNAIHFATAIKVDIFVAGTDPFEQERLRCRTRVQVGSEPIAVLYVDTAEHTRRTQARMVPPWRRGLGAPVARCRGDRAHSRGQPGSSTHATLGGATRGGRPSRAATGVRIYARLAT